MQVDGTPIHIEEVAYHRNGISGEGFHVVTFRYGPTPMVGVVFTGAGQVAVFDRALLGQGTIAFLENSWRGDEFAAVLRDAITAYQQRLLG